MKIWCLFQCVIHEATYLVGVFSSKEKAYEVLEACKLPGRLFVEEIEMDKIMETFYG